MRLPPRRPHGENPDGTGNKLDGGIDLIFERDGVTFLIQAKCYSGKVRSPELIEFMGAKQLYLNQHAKETDKLCRGLFITAGEFFAEDIERKELLGLQLINRTALKAIASLTRTMRDGTVRVALSAEEYEREKWKQCACGDKIAVKLYPSGTSANIRVFQNSLGSRIGSIDRNSDVGLALRTLFGYRLDESYRNRPLPQVFRGTIAKVTADTLEITFSLY